MFSALLTKESNFLTSTSMTLFCCKHLPVLPVRQAIPALQGLYSFLRVTLTLNGHLHIFRTFNKGEQLSNFYFYDSYFCKHLPQLPVRQAIPGLQGLYSFFRVTLTLNGHLHIFRTLNKGEQLSNFYIYDSFFFLLTSAPTTSVPSHSGSTRSV